MSRNNFVRATANKHVIYSRIVPRASVCICWLGNIMVYNRAPMTITTHCGVVHGKLFLNNNRPLQRSQNVYEEIIPFIDVIVNSFLYLFILNITMTQYLYLVGK